jgi:hypothetical protein
MNIHDVNARTVAALATLGWNYVIVGGIAAVHHGLARTTYDVDVVVQLETLRVGELVQLLGEEFELEPQQSFEVFTARSMRVIHLRGTPLKIDVFLLASDPFDQELFRRRSVAQGRGYDFFIPTAEDLIIQKLRWARPKDAEDASAILAVQGAALDFAYIERWCDAHGTRELLDKLRSEIPPL